MSKINQSARVVLFKEGEKATKLYMVKYGKVLCLKGSKDRLIPVFMAQEGDIVGESAMIDDISYTYSAITLTPVELVEIPHANFKQVLSSAPSWLTDLTATMISRFQSTAHLIAENRVIHPLIMEDDQFNSATEVDFKKLLNQ